MHLARLYPKNSYGRASGSTYVIGNTEQSYGITYKDISGLLDTYTTPHNSFTYSYDNFDRLTRKLGDKHSIQYTYVNGSQRVNTYTISQATSQQTVYAYTYDNLGNITSVKKNGTTISNYEYDKLGRLIREDDCASNVCWVYAYDKAGNLLNKYEFPSAGPNVAHWMGAYPYVGEIVSTYGYSTSGWKDLLTNYNGTTITYDQIGNPLNWRNATNMSWDKRALQSMTLSNGTTLSFEYNADGIRNKKIYGGTVHTYILDGTTILKETIGASNGLTTLYYYYDESGISGVSYNGTKYSYVRNLQGDVIAILNSYGGTAVEYKYDAWGNILSVTGALASTLGAVNPFRYRGYYYDTETGFYYLNSRYYDPQVGRFLNADEPILLGANGGIMGYNMFAYCNNNPVMHTDANGHWLFDWEDVSNAWNGICDTVCDAWDTAAEWSSNAWDATTEWASNAWTETKDWVSETSEKVKTVVSDTVDIVLENTSISGGICAGFGGSYDVSGVGVEAIARMDVIGFRLVDKKLMLGRNEREAICVSAKSPACDIDAGVQYDAFYDLNDNLITEDLTVVDAGKSVGVSAALGIGVHIEFSVSYSDILVDLFEYYSSL